MDAFHLAMLACAGLLAMGAFVAWYGLREGAGVPGHVVRRARRSGRLTTRR